MLFLRLFHALKCLFPLVMPVTRNFVSIGVKHLKWGFLAIQEMRIGLVFQFWGIEINGISTYLHFLERNWNLTGGGIPHRCFEYVFLSGVGPIPDDRNTNHHRCKFFTGGFASTRNGCQLCRNPIPASNKAVVGVIHPVTSGAIL